KQSYVLASSLVDVTAIRLRTLDNYGNTVTRIHELEAIGDATGPTHTFIAQQNYNKQSYVLPSAVVDLTDIRLRTLDNYGNTVTRIHELEAIGDATGPTHTFIAQQNYNKQSYVLPSAVVDLTDIRLRTLDNYGNTVTRIHELEAIGDATGPSHTFIALQNYNKQSYVLDSVVSDLTDIRLRTLDNYGNTVTRIHELEAIGDATGPSHTFIAQQNYSRQTFVLSALVSNVTDIKLRTLDNYGNTVTRIHEFGAEAIADGPSYVFSALQSNALQNYTFADSSARIFRFKVFDNFGNTQTIARDISLNSTLCLAGKWDMDELSWNGSAGEVIDSSGSNHNGTAINGALTKNVASAVPGSPGTCGYGSFDGINDYVALPNFPDLTESFTISAWIKPHVINKDQRIYVDDENNSGGFAFSLGDGGNGRLRFFSRQVSPVSIDTQSAVIPLADQWYFVTAVHDSINKTRQIFVNGQPQQLTSGSTVSVYSGTWGSDPGMASIGGETNNAGSEAVPNWRFDGDIDEVRIYHQALTQTEIQAVMADTHPCISLLDHFQIQHDGQGISCAAEPVSVAAHAIDHSVVSSYAGSILLNTNSGKGSWNLVSGNGTFVDATANDGLANYSFDASDNGVAQFSLDYTEGASPINISVSDSGIVDDDTEGLLSFAPSGFVITASPLANPPPSPVNDPLPAQTAGSNFNFSITAFGQTPANPQCGVIESYTGIKPVNFWSNYSNPTTGTLTPTINTQSIAATEVASTPQNITFNNGQAQVIAKYKDVGAIQIALKDADLSAHSNIIQGASNNFVVKPADFVTTVTGNPAAASASGAVFKKAGESFQLQVDVLDAEGDRTPNYGNETVAETLRVKSSQLMAPVGGRNGVDGAGTLANNSAFVAVVPGQFENTTTSFSEVGIIRLQTEVGDGDYLGAGNITGTETANVGRFIPDRFQISSNNPSFRNGDSSWGCGFSYQSQPFEFATGLNPQLTLTALSETGTPTFNYAASFWKLSTSLSNRDYVNQLAGVSAVLTADKTSASVSLTGINDFSDGQGLLTISGDQLSYVKAAAIPSANDAPFDADVKLSIPVSDLTDSDGVCVDADNDGICEAYNSTNISGTQLRWGRWFVENVLGSELENLDLLATAEYFDGSMFQLNSADSCSATISGWIPPTLTAYTDNLAPGETLLTQSVMSSGLLPFVLSAPGEGNDGSLLFTLPTPAWMFYDYDGNGTADGASATVTFGVYKGKKPVIYWRQKFGN
ncbi:MAG TPA: LamG domain-containing protein, partial [Aeromonadales bacterium]|nr:LamG domain-containing protein [Aeromonadales bacterium]